MERGHWRAKGLGAGSLCPGHINGILQSIHMQETEGCLHCLDAPGKAMALKTHIEEQARERASSLAEQAGRGKTSKPETNKENVMPDGVGRKENAHRQPGGRK